MVGGLVFWGGGVRGGALLALFFVSGSVLTARQERQQRQERQNIGRHDPLPPLPLLPPLRTARQVIANGAWAAVGAMAVPHRPALGWPLLVGALATAQADTWASEIGAHAHGLPRLITTGEPVPSGTSGAISPLGTTGGLLGALAMGGLAAGLGVSPAVAAAGTIAGIAGMIADSLLGASLQASYRCARCRTRCEQPMHCGEPAARVAGLAWLDNDGVNLAATSAGALAAMTLAGWPA